MKERLNVNKFDNFEFTVENTKYDENSLTIYNPVTNRVVLKRGNVGKRILRKIQKN